MTSRRRLSSALLPLLVMAFAFACGDGDSSPDAAAPLPDAEEREDGSSPPRDADSESDADSETDDAGTPPDADGGADPGRDAAPLPPPNAEGVVTNFASSVAFLYEPGGPQTGVAPGAIDPRRVAVIRGRVNDTAGAPIAGVAITVRGAPQFGRAETNAAGVFDLAVDGGKRLIIDAAKMGYLPVQRAIDTPWTDFAMAGELVLTALDPAMTTVALGAGGVVQTARGSVTADADGMRQASVIFPAGTTAELVMPDGTTMPFGGGIFRATEFTVGEKGLEAMPGTLPPLSGYTYAVEFSFDEALTAGAASVRFSRPVISFVDNFLGVAAGQIVPTGAYDRLRGEWVPVSNGVVVDLLGVVMGLATVDANGDGMPDDSTVLAQYGITDEELTELAMMYPLGGSVWRVAIEHFTPYDCNWPPFFPAGAFGPPWWIHRFQHLKVPCGILGSFVDCEGQTLREKVNISGTPFSLVYQTERTPGRTFEDRVVIPLSGDTLPPEGFDSIEVRASIAGQEIHEIRAPAPNLSYEYIWDHHDAFGRPVFGSRLLAGEVVYVFESRIMEPGSAANPEVFGEPGSSIEAVGVYRLDRKLEMIMPFEAILGTNGPDAREVGLGGWTLSVHHVLDPANGTVFLGSGGRTAGEQIVEHFAGVEGQPFPIEEGTPVASTPFDIDENSLRMGPDGTIYFLNQKELCSIGTDGNFHVVVGCDSQTQCETSPPIDDGRRAGEIPMRDQSLAMRITNYALGYDGRIYFALEIIGFHSLWMVDFDGSVRRIAGKLDARNNNPTTGETLPLTDGNIARDGPISNIIDLTVGPDGAVYFVQEYESINQIWRVGPSNRLSHFAGSLNYGAHCSISGIDERPARDKCFDVWRDIAADRLGNVYIVARGTVWRVRPDSMAERFAGVENDLNCQPTADDVARKDSCMAQTRELQFGPDHVPYANVVLDSNRGGIIRLGDIAHVVYGGGTSTALGSAGRSYTADRNVQGWGGFTIDLHGDLLIRDIDGGYDKILKLIQPAVILGDQYVVADEDGRVAWVFDQTGRHLSTRDIFTGATILSFGYSTEGKLETITDRNGRVTTIERDAGGAPEAIVAPSGARTTLTLDGNGWLSKVEKPGGAHYDLTYVDERGLLATFSDPLQRGAQFTWDTYGRLTSETTRLGGEMTLARQELPTGGHQVTMTSEGRSTIFQTMLLDSAVSRSVIEASGAVSSMITHEDGTRTIYGTEGTISTLIDDVDPRFPISYTKSHSIVKGARTLAIETLRTLSGGTGLFGSGTMTQEVTVEGKTWSLALDGAARTLVQTTPAGRTRTIGYDALGRATSISRGAGFAPTTLQYGPTGLLELFDLAGRTHTYEYDPQRRPIAVVDPRRRTEFTYDSAGRPNSITDPTGTFAVAWDAAGGMDSFALPGGGAHVLESNAHGGYTSYTPPGAAAPYRRIYDDTRGALEQIVLPSGRAQTYNRDSSGRFSTIVWPEATVAFTWATPADFPATMTRTPASGMAHTTTFTWDNALPVTVETSGATSGSWTVGFDAQLRPELSAFTSGADMAANSIAYDDDGQVVQFGPLMFTRAGPDRYPSEVAVGSARVAYTYDMAGRLASKTVRVNGADRYSLDVHWDPTGVVLDRTEVSNGVTHPYVYTHDAGGRLERVERDGTEVETYAHDAHGNRTGPGAATYDGQDRLLARGGVAYTIDDDGFLSARGGDTFNYSAAGELIAANIGGTQVTYEFDAFRRLVRRTQAGQSTQLYYADPFLVFRPSAYRAPGEALTSLYYDGSGHLTAIARGGARWIIASDQVGTPRLVIEESTGNTVKAIERDSFGRILTDSNPSFVMPIGFAGGIEDPLTGLVRFGYRDYEPLSGRWTARDPILLSGGQFNLYTYVGSSPVSFRDPLGLFCVGGSGYGGMGGGGKFCVDDKGLSACAELGVGVGTSVDVQPWAKIDGNTFGFEAGAKLGVGPAGFGCEGTYAIDLDKVGRSPCALLKDGDCKGGLLGVEMSAIKGQEGDTIGPLDIAKALGFTPPGEGDEEGGAFALQGKLAVKGCQNLGWNLF